MKEHNLEYINTQGKLQKITFYIWLSKYYNGAISLVINNENLEDLTPESIKLTTNLMDDVSHFDEKDIIFIEDNDEDLNVRNSLYSIKKYTNYLLRMKLIEPLSSGPVQSGYKKYQAYKANTKLISGKYDPLEELLGKIKY